MEKHVGNILLLYAEYETEYLIGKYFDVEVINYNKYKSAKVKPFKDEIRTAALDKGLLAEETPSTVHSITLIDSIIHK